MKNEIKRKFTKRYKILLLLIALQSISSFFYLQLNPDFVIDAIIVIVLSTIIIPVGYLVGKNMSILLSLLWFTGFSTWLFTFVEHENRGGYGYVMIFTITFILLYSAYVREAENRFDAAYVSYAKSTNTSFDLIDAYTGFYNSKAFEEKVNIFKRTSKQLPSFEYYICGIKMPFYDEIVEKIGHEKYTEYLINISTRVRDKYDVISNFYAIDSSFFVFKLTFVEEDQVIQLMEDIKKSFMQTIGKYQIDVQVSFLSSRELEIRNIVEYDDIIKEIKDRVEVDLNAEYF